MKQEEIRTVVVPQEPDKKPHVRVIRNALWDFQRTAPDELSPQMIIHDLTALKVNKLPAMQRSIDAAIEIIREAKV